MKQESFYIDGQHNTKLSVLKTDSAQNGAKKKSVKKYAPGSVALIPTNDENEPSQAWLKKHSLAQLKLDLHKMVSGPECKCENDG